jgi:hypothetical protein
MNSRLQPQTRPTAHPLPNLRVLFREMLRGDRGARSIKSRSSSLFSLFLHEELQNLPFVFNNLPTLLHSCKNKSFVCTLFTKTPRGYPPPLPTPKALLELRHHSSHFQFSLFHFLFPTPSSLFSSHEPRVASHQFPIWLLSAPPSTQTIDGCGLYLEPANKIVPLHASRSNHGHRNHFTFNSLHRLAPGMA